MTKGIMGTLLGVGLGVGLGGLGVAWQHSAWGDGRATPPVTNPTTTSTTSTTTSTTPPVNPYPERVCWDLQKPPEGCMTPEDLTPTPVIQSTCPPVPPIHAPGAQFRTHDLSGNRHNMLSAGTLQVVTFYDGDDSGRPMLRIEMTSPLARGMTWVEIENVHGSTSNGGRIGTFEYDAGHWQPTGRFEVRGVQPNGVIDGLAFGLVWRDMTGAFHRLRSTAPEPAMNARFVGAWPLALSDGALAKRASDVTTGHGRQQTRLAIMGAELLDNGIYTMPLHEREVAVVQ